MKVFHIAAGIRKEAGGPSYTIPALCSSLEENGVNIELNLLKGENQLSDCTFDVKEYSRVPPNKLGISPEMKKSLLVRVHSNDVMHSHGIWMMPNIYPLKVARHTGAKFVLTLHGMLTEWSLNNSKFKKKIIGALGQNSAILNADCIHVTAESEYEDIRSFGYNGPVALIPNGVGIPRLTFSHDKLKNERKKIIFISRVHPKKGIEILIESWKRLSHTYKNWDLIICGPGEHNYISHIKSLIDAEPSARIQYKEPVYGVEKDKFYQEASLFVLPTFSENFGMVVAEALSYGIPSIVTTGAPWSGIYDKQCGWWIDNSVSELTETLNIALNMPNDELFEMGKAGRKWMEEDFSWDEIAKKTKSTYQWLFDKESKFDFIRID